MRCNDSLRLACCCRVPAPPGEKAHLFRHTYGIAQIDRGTSLPELQALMGHENISTTSTYLRIAADGLHHTARATAVNALIEETLRNHRSRARRSTTRRDLRRRDVPKKAVLVLTLVVMKPSSERCRCSA